MFRSPKRKLHAFTLIEMMVVIAVAAIIIAIAVPAWRSYYLRISAVSAANTLAEDLHTTSVMALQSQCRAVFSYNTSGYTDTRMGSDKKKYYSCYKQMANKDSSVNTKARDAVSTPLDTSKIYLSSAKNGTALTTASATFGANGRIVGTPSGFVKSGNDYTIYVVCPNVVSVPVKIMASGKVQVD